MVQEARGPKGWGVTGVVSTALTLTPNRGCTPERNRRISTIPAGCTDAGPVNVSTVDTRPRRSESPWVLRQCPASPSQIFLHRSLPATCAEGREAMTRRRLRLEPRLELACSTRVGTTGQGLCVLHEGPTYPKCTRPSSSSTPPLVQCVQTTTAATTVTWAPHSGRLKQQLAQLADAPHRCLEMS